MALTAVLCSCCWCCLMLTVLSGGAESRHQQVRADSISSESEQEDRAVQASGQEALDQQILGQLQSISEQLLSLDHRTERIEQQLQALEQRQGGVEKLPKKSELAFRLTRVEKRVTVDFYRIKVIYEGSTQPTILVQYSGNAVTKQGEDGEAEFDIPHRSGSAQAWVSFILPQQVITAVILLSRSARSQNIPHLDFQVMQGPDITYDPGQNLTVDFTFDIEDEDEDEDSNVQTDFVSANVLVRSPSRDNLILRYGYKRDDKISLHQQVLMGPKGHRFGRFVLLSQAEQVEGIAEINYGVVFGCDGNCLVYHLHNTLRLEFHRSDHQDPFLKDFIGFVHGRNAFGFVRAKTPLNSEAYCQEREPFCRLSCEAMGEGLSAVQMTKLTSADDPPLTSNLSVVREGWGQTWLDFPNVTVQDAGQVRCTARTEAREVSELLSFVVVRPARIDRNLSAVTFLQNGSVVVTCLGEGWPAPNVTLRQRGGPGGQEHVTRVTHPAPTQTRAQVTFADRAQLGDLLPLLACTASNVPDNVDLHVHEDYVPVLLLNG